MRRSTVDFAAVRTADHALPHALDLDGHTQVLPLDIERNVLPIAPAGAVWSTVEDLARYALTELGRGAYSGRRARGVGGGGGGPLATTHRRRVRRLRPGGWASRCGPACASSGYPSRDPGLIDTLR
jgi:hypothetical protein